MISWWKHKLRNLTEWLERVDDSNNFYIYKDKIYYCNGCNKDCYRKTKNPETGEWFDTIKYTAVEFFTREDGVKFFRTYDGQDYYRDVEDFKKKFKKCPKSKIKAMKEIY